MKRLIIGTLNEHKGRELREMLVELPASAGKPVTIELLSTFKGVKPTPENGATLRENAALKALGFARQIDEFVLADDSGLEVDALDGAPGVRSARYAGPNSTYPQLIAKLLREMQGVPAEKRTARFRCCVCLARPFTRRGGPCGGMASPEGIALEAEGVCEGRIVFEPRGTGGFGYDPVFVPDGYDKTFAELGPDVKNRLSHRGAAIREFRKRFMEYYSANG